MQIIKRLTVATTTLLLVLSTVPAIAQQNQTGSGLSISPTISEFSLKSGQADKVDITLKNITIGDIIAQAYVNDFLADDKTGSPKIITDPNKQSPNSIRSFVAGLEDVPLAKAEQKKVSVLIQIPANTPPGAYFGIIRYKAVPASGNVPKEGEVALSASVGTIVLVTVPGTIREQVQLSRLRIYSGTSEGSFFINKPTNIGVEIKNLGNGFIKPFGAVEIRDIFSKEVYTYQLNNSTPRANILPDSSRIFKNSVKNIGKIGRYTATASVSYGSGSEVLVSKKTFWYVPGWLVVVILAIAVLLIWAVLRAYRRWRHGAKHAYSHKR